MAESRSDSWLLILGCRYTDRGRVTASSARLSTFLARLPA